VWREVSVEGSQCGGKSVWSVECGVWSVKQFSDFSFQFTVLACSLQFKLDKQYLGLNLL